LNVLPVSPIGRGARRDDEGTERMAEADMAAGGALVLVAEPLGVLEQIAGHCGRGLGGVPAPVVSAGLEEVSG
jgi:hypothetical protein